MLYMEDFLELIEPFPQEIRERLTEMREIDLRVQNDSDKLDTRVETFFQACKKQKLEWRMENLEDIKKEYGKLFENSDEKIQIANQLYDLIEKYIKKLDQELHRFKLELEADHAGITSKLEQVLTTTPADGLSGGGVNMLTGGLGGMDYGLDSLNFNNPSDDSDFTLCPSSTSDLMLMMLNPSLQHQQSQSGADLTPSNQKRKHSNLSDKNSSSSTINLLNALNSRDDDESNSSWTTSSSHMPLQAGGHVFAMPLSNKKSQLSMSSHKRGSSMSAPKTTSQSSDLLSLLQSPATHTVINTQTNRRQSTSKSLIAAGNKRKRDQIKNRSRLNDYDFDDESSSNLVDEESNLDYQSDETSDEMGIESVGEQSKRTGGGDADDLMTSDEDEDMGSSKLKVKNRSQPKEDSGEETNERYCICKDVSYGNMIACDNSNCSTQWFHFTCVGLSSAPKGKWFCPNCTEIKKKRRERHLSILQGSSNTVLSPLATQPSSSAGTIDFQTPNVNQFITPQDP